MHGLRALLLLFSTIIFALLNFSLTGIIVSIIATVAYIKRGSGEDENPWLAFLKFFLATILLIFILSFLINILR